MDDNLGLLKLGAIFAVALILLGLELRSVRKAIADDRRKLEDQETNE